MFNEYSHRKNDSSHHPNNYYERYLPHNFSQDLLKIGCNPAQAEKEKGLTCAVALKILEQQHQEQKCHATFSATTINDLWGIVLIFTIGAVALELFCAIETGRSPFLKPNEEASQCPVY